MAHFYLDNDLPLRMVALLHAADHNAVTTRELGLASAEDYEHLLTAARQNATLISHNAKDFALLHGAWRLWSQEWGVAPQHAGILLLLQPTGAERVRGVLDAEHLARLVVDLATRGNPRPNELWQWQRGPGWVRSR